MIIGIITNDIEQARPCDVPVFFLQCWDIQLSLLEAQIYLEG